MTALSDSLHLTIDVGGLAAAYGPRLTRFVARRIGNGADVEDIVQDTLLEACGSAGRFRGESSPQTWLCAIAMNRIRLHYRSRERHAKYHSNVDVDDNTGEDRRDDLAAHDPHAYYEARQALRRIEARMGSMSDTLVEPLRLLVDEDLSYQEIAARLNVPIGTVRSRISRARDGISDEGAGRR